MNFYFRNLFADLSALRCNEFRILCLAIAVLSCCSMIPTTSADAQLDLGRLSGSETDDADGSGSASRNKEPGEANLRDVPPGKLFRIMLDRIKFNESEVNRLYSSMPLGFPELQKEHTEKIELLKAQTKQLRGGLDQAALNAFKANPGQDPVATQFVFRMLSEMIDPKLPDSEFDPASALQIVDTLMEAGADQDVVILSKGFRASFAIEDFDRAGLMLDRIAKANPEGDLTQIRQVVEDMKEKWQRELSIRRLEKNNDNLPKVKFETTAGEFIVALYEDYAPNTVANFISLVEKKFYNDLIFHYVKPGEYIHTGCPNGDATGGPGYSIPSEYNREQIRHFFSGTLGMANTGTDTEGSQFVITHQAIPQLNGNFTAFGRVIKGFDVIRTAKQVSPTDPPPLNEDDTREPIKIIKAEVVWKRDHEYEPQRVTKSVEDSPLDGLGNETLSDPGDLFAPRAATEDVPALDGGGLFTPSQP